MSCPGSIDKMESDHVGYALESKHKPWPVQPYPLIQVDIMDMKVIAVVAEL